MGVKVGFWVWFLSEGFCSMDDFVVSKLAGRSAMIGCRPVIRASALGKERMVFFCHTDALSR
jgi:hypothetical protein